MEANYSLIYQGVKQKNPLELGGCVTVHPMVTRYEEFHATHWVLYLENTSEENSRIISDLYDCDVLLPLAMPSQSKAGYRPTKGNACVITMNGMVPGRFYWENDKISASEYGLNFEYLDKAPNQTKCFSNRGGRSSEGMMPFFDVTAGGKGYLVAIGWTGSWKAEFTACEDGILVKSGLQQTNFYLKPGEKIRTSSVLIMKYENEEEKYNQFRRLIRTHFSFKGNSQREGLMACELWGGLTSEEMIKRLKEFQSYGISFEDIWIDAGWYGNCTKCDEPFGGDWGHHTGEWEVNQRVHPDGLKEVSECANQGGSKLMLWFEPERAISGTGVTKEHPEWFLTLPQNKNQILYYGNEEATEYVISLLSDYCERLSLSCYRQDFNIELSPFFEAHDEENRRGITEIKHITGIYRMWDTLLKRFPGLIIDNCSSGGRRIDIETLKRSIPFFRSDYQCNFNENPEVLQTHNANISLYLPYNGCTSKTKNDTYAIRSSYSSSWGGAFYNAVFQSMSHEDFLWAKQITEEYRSIRQYFSRDFYNHGSLVYDESSWAIFQYHDPDEDRGIVLAFRRCQSPFSQVTIDLKGLNPQKEYQFTNMDTQQKWVGKEEITIVLKEKRSCVLFKYE